MFFVGRSDKDRILLPILETKGDVVFGKRFLTAKPKSI
jgi:DNA primase